MPDPHNKDKMEYRSRHSDSINMEQQPKKSQLKKGIMYPDNKNKSFRVNVRPTGWDDTCKLWFGKIKDLTLAQIIADIAFFLTGSEPVHNTVAYKKILPVDNDDLRSFRTREEFLDYVKSKAKGTENLAKRKEFKACLIKIIATVKHDFEEHDKEVAKTVEKPLPLVSSRRYGVPLPRLPPVEAASSSGSEGLCEDEMEVVDQSTNAESNHIDDMDEGDLDEDGMDEDANDSLAGVPTALEANTGDVYAKVSGKVECQAMDESDQNEGLLEMIAGAHRSYGSPLEYKMTIPGRFMDKGDEDFVFVLPGNIPLFTRNQGDGGLFTFPPFNL